MTQHKIVFGDSRRMSQIADKSVQLIITSPPYWQLKDYGTDDQIGFNNSYEEYINNLNLVWKECDRVLAPGCRLCINIGMQGDMSFITCRVTKILYDAWHGQEKKYIYIFIYEYIFLYILYQNKLH